MSCSGEAPAAASEHPWRISASYGFVWTRVEFDGHIDGTLFQRAIAATVSRRFGKRLTVLGSAGAVLGGDIDLADGSAAQLSPGALLATGIAWQILDGTGWKPFLTLSGVLSGSWQSTLNAMTHETSTYAALDIKAIAIVGYTFWRRVSPYVGASAFGGPIFWTIDHNSVLGTDRSHYQVLAGINVSLPLGVDLFAEGSPLGERALSAGAGLSF